MLQKLVDLIFGPVTTLPVLKPALKPMKGNEATTFHRCLAVHMRNSHGRSALAD